MSAAMFHWIADERGRLHKVKSIDGRAVSVAIDDKFYQLSDKEEEYYNRILNQNKESATNVISVS